MSVIFTRGATSVTLPTYTHDFARDLDPGTRAIETQGGTVIAQANRPKKTFWRLQFFGLSEAQMIPIENFFMDTIRGAYYPFTFFDYDATNESSGGNSYNVRWWNKWAFRRNPSAPDLWDGNIILREE